MISEINSRKRLEFFIVFTETITFGIITITIISMFGIGHGNGVLNKED